MTTAWRAAAQFSRSRRRANDMAMPSGDWCDGVTQTMRASAGNALTSSPSASTGTGANLAPAPSSAARSGG